jgi:hypothetical protein
MKKIASHIKNPSKFGKASKLALQLIQAGSIKNETSNQFYAVLEAAMQSLSTCNEPSVRADYHELFTAAQDVTEVFFLYFIFILFDIHLIFVISSSQLGIFRSSISILMQSLNNLKHNIKGLY